MFLIVALLSGGCASSAPVDKVGLYYTGGPLQGRHFKKIIQPGSGSTVLGFGDTVAWLPSGQRDYIVSKTAGEGDREGQDFIRVPAKGGVLMDFEVSTYFKLNTRTDDLKGFKGGTIRKFYEQVCKKFHCTEESGWNKMLNNVFRKVLESAMQERIRQYDVGTLYANTQGGQGDKSSDVLLAVQTDVGKTLKQRINSVFGADYFCGPSFDRAKAGCPDFQFIINSAEPTSQAVRDSFEKIRQSQNDIATATNNAQVKKQEAEGTAAAQQASQASLTPQYLTFLYIQALQQCAQSQGCTMIASPDGANVNVNAGGPR